MRSSSGVEKLQDYHYNEYKICEYLVLWKSINYINTEIGYADFSD